MYFWVDNLLANCFEGKKTETTKFKNNVKRELTRRYTTFRQAQNFIYNDELGEEDSTDTGDVQDEEDSTDRGLINSEEEGLVEYDDQLEDGDSDSYE